MKDECGYSAFRLHPSGPLLLLFHRPQVRKRYRRVHGHWSRASFELALVAVGTTAILGLPSDQLGSQSAPPVVLSAIGRFEGVLAVGIQGLGEGVVVVVHPCVAHAGVLLQAVV